MVVRGLVPPSRPGATTRPDPLPRTGATNAFLVKISSRNAPGEACFSLSQLELVPSWWHSTIFQSIFNGLGLPWFQLGIATSLGGHLRPACGLRTVDGRTVLHLLRRLGFAVMTAPVVTLNGERLWAMPSERTIHSAVAVDIV